MSLFPALFTGFTLVLGCTTRSLPTEYPADSALSAVTPVAVPTSPASLAGELLVAANTSDGVSKHEHSVHDHSVLDHSEHRHAEQDHSKHIGGSEGGRSAAVGEGSAEPSSDDGSARAPKYACPMHPEETSPKPGQCPVCGMNLERVK